MDDYEYIWLHMDDGEQNTVIELLINGKRYDAIKYVSTTVFIKLRDSMMFIDSKWMLHTVLESDQVLGKIAEALNYIHDTKTKEKYKYIITHHAPILLDLI